MINTVDEFMEEFMKHKDKVEWYLHQPTPFANLTDIRGKGVLCSPLTVMCTPPVHYHLDFLDLDVEIHHSFELVVKNASEFSLGSLEEAIEKYPREKFPQSRAREAYELRRRLLDALGLAEPEDQASTAS